MAVVQDDDAVRLVALMTPPHALVLSTGHAGAIPCLIEGLGAAAIRPPGVSGVEQIAEHSPPPGGAASVPLRGRNPE